jgi:hypothetical protein
MKYTGLVAGAKGKNQVQTKKKKMAREWRESARMDASYSRPFTPIRGQKMYDGRISRGILIEG